jgi:hypothetical protein
MAEKKGHFEKGRWIDEEEAAGMNAAGAADESGEAGAEGTGESIDDFDEKIAELRSSVSKNLSDLFGIGKALITTEKGREHLAKKVKKAEEKIEGAVEDISKEFEKATRK